MRHRVFIAINLPKKIKAKLIEYQEQWSELPVRWTKEESIHLTLAFLGNLSDDEVVKVCQAVKGIGQKHSPFSIQLSQTSYGPKEKSIPRLVWLKGERSKELDLLKKDLDDLLVKAIGFVSENREFLPHITLGRIRKWEWQRIEPEERPDISQDFPFSFEVESIEVMESHLKRGGAQYFVLESIPLEKI